MTRESIEVTRQNRIYCLKASSGYHSEVCEECKFYPNCDHMTQDDMTELTIKDLETLEQEPRIGHWIVHPKGIYAHLVCDNCLSNAPYDCRTNYCPNCGCRMVESQESEGANDKKKM